MVYRLLSLPFTYRGEPSWEHTSDGSFSVTVQTSSWIGQDLTCKYSTTLTSISTPAADTNAREIIGVYLGTRFRADTLNRFGPCRQALLNA